MIFIQKILSIEEISELEMVNELFRGVMVNNCEIICFQIIIDLYHRKIEIKDLSRETLVLVYEQINKYKLFWEDIIWFDNEKIENILPKVKGVIKARLDIKE